MNVLPEPVITPTSKAVDGAHDEPLTPRDIIERRLTGTLVGGHVGVAAHEVAVTPHGIALLALLMSDVPGDDPSIVASGPTVADPTTFAQARDMRLDQGEALTAPMA